MAKRVALPRLLAGAVVALAMFMTVKVEAVTLTITAAAVCQDSGGWRINYTASVAGNGGVSNPSVNILVDGSVADNGAFVAPSFSFSDSLAAPAGSNPGDVVDVSLNVVGTWSNGTLPGEANNTASTSVTLPSDCTPRRLAGCTPGYWKQPQHFDSWPAPYEPDMLFNELPGFANAFPGKTLLQVLSQGGGGKAALGRHTVAAMLNTASGFGLELDKLQDLFNLTYFNRFAEQAKDLLAWLNERGCPLN
jgi:hypothetical protein